MSDADSWSRLRALLDGAYDLPPKTQDDFLIQACTGADGTLDTTLLAEARALLDADAEAATTGFLAGPVAERAAHLLTEAAPVPDERVGPWKLVGLLGEGGMGVVYRAERADGAYTQEAALKLIGRGLAPPSLVERFRRERQILAGLSHPHVARLLDGGVSASGQPYFAMELVDGESLTRYVARCDLTVEARLRLFLQVCEAVAYAHARLVVHRDLKPSNVLVEETAGGPQVKLLDFGIAKLLAEDEGAPALTRTGPVLTPEYAAPEQVTGASITTATDVYALGVLLFEVLTGRRPYTFEKTTPTEVERVITGMTPPAPSSLGGRRLGRDLDTVVLKALEKEPERRYATAAALGDDVRRYLAGLPIEARRATVGYRMRTFVRRHPLGVAAVTVIAALLVGFSAVTSVQARRLAAERDRAQTEADKAEEMQDYLVGLFTAVSPDVAQGRDISARELLDEGAARVETEFADRPLIQAELFRTIGFVYQGLGRYAESADYYGRTLTLYRRVHGEAHPDVVRMHSHLGAALFRLGEPEAADSVHRAGIALLPRTFDGPDAIAAALYADLATVRNSLGDYAEADSLFRRAIALGEAAPNTEPENLTRIVSGLGVSLHDRGAYAEADSLFRRALLLQQEAYGPAHSEIALTHHYLGLVARHDGRLADAARSYAEALALRRLLLGDDHPDTALTLQNLAVVYRHLGRYAEAEALYRETLATSTRLLGTDHSQVAIIHNNLASVLVSAGRAEEALPHAETALRGMAVHFGADHANVGLVLNTRGRVRFDLGRYAEAEADFRRGLRIHRAAVGGAHPRQGTLLIGLGRALHAQGQRAEGESVLREARALLIEEHGPDDARVAEAETHLAEVLGARGQTQEARPLVAHARSVLESVYGADDDRARLARRVEAALR